ncbi:hypothetical protein ACIQZD_25865, partial [Peribacillus sp. NPDC096447]|uniref:hypothetical protein n=1 Tax=Peribacillus sp. NPDC096447 TaxID=3364394 RepID=UPI00380F00DF
KCLTCSFAFLIVCAHLKFNVGALFCSVFKERFIVVTSQATLLSYHLPNLMSTTILYCFLIEQFMMSLLATPNILSG